MMQELSNFVTVILMETGHIVSIIAQAYAWRDYENRYKTIIPTITQHTFADTFYCWQRAPLPTDNLPRKVLPTV